MSKNNCASFTWSIHNFSYCWQKTGEAITSPKFYTNTSEETKWKLRMFPRGEHSDDESIDFYLCKRKRAKEMKVVYALDLVKSDGTYMLNIKKGTCRIFISKNKIAKFNCMVNITKANESQSMESGSSKYIAKSRIKSQYLHKGILTIRFYMISIDGERTKKRQILARTIIAIEKRFLQWTIPNFSDFEPDKMLSFLMISESKEVIMEINLSITDSEKKMIESGQFQNWFNCGNCASYYLNKTKNNLMENQSLYLPNDSLTLSFESTVSTGIAFEGIESDAFGYTIHPFSDPPSEDWQKCICQKNILDCSCAQNTDLTSLCEDQSTCDMKLATKTNIFPVHTLILSARSPVFKTIFSNDMKVKETGCVDVSDLNDETVRRFLKYLYSNKLEDIEFDDASQLYNAANKYQVISLKKKCSMFLKLKLNLENACKALKFSYLHKDDDLKETTQEFILKNAKDIFKSEKWKNLMDDNFQLAYETIIRNWKEE